MGQTTDKGRKGHGCQEILRNTMLSTRHLGMVTFRSSLGDMMLTTCHLGWSYSEVQLGLS